MQQQSEQAGTVASNLLSDAKGLGGAALNRIHSEVDSRKSGAAEQVKAVSSSIQHATEGLDDNAPTWLKSALEQGAQQVQMFADTLEQKDSRQLLSEVGDFARRSPTVFLAACAAAGFAASRIFKAGGSSNTPQQPRAVGDAPDNFPAMSSAPQQAQAPTSASGATA